MRYFVAACSKDCPANIFLGKHVHLVQLFVPEVVCFSISGCQKLFMHNLLDFVSLSSFSISVRPEYVNGLFCET